MPAPGSRLAMAARDDKVAFRLEPKKLVPSRKGFGALYGNILMVNHAPAAKGVRQPSLETRIPRYSAALCGRVGVGVALLISVVLALGDCHRTTGDMGWGATSGSASSESGSAVADASSPMLGASVLFARNHVNRDGLFTNTGITKASVATLQRDSTFAGAVNGAVFASPLYAEDGPQGQGAFFVATENNNIYALDETLGTPLPGWPIQAGTPAVQSTSLATGCLSVAPIGITGTPSIDPATRLIVFDAVTGDSTGNIAAHTIQAWSIDNPMAGPTWSIDVSAKWPAFVAQSQLQRSAVLIVNGVAYIAFGSFNDCAPYHGWVIAVPVANPGAAQAFMTPVVGAGLWGPGGPASDGTSVFAVTGNRREDFGDASPSWAGSNAVFRFGPSVTFSGKAADYFVPSTWDQLDRIDDDLGASGPLVVDAPGMNPSALLVQIGKQGIAYVLDRNNLGGLDGGPLASKMLVQGIPGIEGQLINVPAWATVAGTTYIIAKAWYDASAADCPLPADGGVYDLMALRLDPTSPNGMTTAWCVSSGGMGSPSITMSDDSNDALVWTAGAEGDGLLHAWDLVTGAPVYTSAAPALPALRHFVTPLAVYGRILVAGDGMLYAFTSDSNSK